MDLKISMETIMISAGLLLTFLVFIRISYKRKSKIDIKNSLLSIFNIGDTNINSNNQNDEKKNSN
jgi:hypothetical protein